VSLGGYINFAMTELGFFGVC